MSTDKKPKNTVRNIDRGNDPSGTDPNRHSKGYAKKNNINSKSKAMSNRNTIIGIAAGVAALAVVGSILRRRGYFDNFSEKAEEFGANVKDTFNTVKDKARRQFDNAIDKGSEIADQAKTDAKISTEKELAKAAVNVATS